MPKGLKRFQASRQTHFVTFSCYHRTPKLTDAAACQLFLKALEAARNRLGILVYGYVLMPEHVHILLSEPESGTLAAALRSIKVSTTKQLRAMSRADGVGTAFWQARYYDRNIRDYDEFVLKLRYLHRNPVKRGLCQSPEQWPWSSFLHYRSGVRGIVEIESEWTAALREQRKAPGQRRTKLGAGPGAPL